MSADLARLERALQARGLRGEQPFAKPELVEEALTHSSFASERGGRHNERLEMLGDSVVGFLVTDLLFDLVPDAPEGVLTRLRAALVDEASLAMRARGIGLGEAMAVGRGEERSGGRDRDSLLADGFEAFVAALYRSEGLDEARRLVRGLFTDVATELARTGVTSHDFKTRLQERAQAERKLVPSYRVVQSTGPDHARTFTVEVELGGEVVGRGEGRTKKVAEQQAARAALEAWT